MSESFRPGVLEAAAKLIRELKRIPAELRVDAMALTCRVFCNDDDARELGIHPEEATNVR